jgi:hypothetical protein
LTDDYIYGKRVVGFAFAASSVSPTGADDRLLFEGDEDLLEPPPRPMPAGDTPIDRRGLLPPCRLAAERLLPVAEVAPELPARVEAAMGEWGWFISAVLDAVAEAGHQAWVAGGCVRDLVAGAAPEDVNDIDLCGTVPTGLMAELIDRVLRREQMSTYVRQVSPATLIVSVAPKTGGKRLLEYKALVANGFRFPASGSDLTDDARARDLTVNCLYYDRVGHFIFDPTGRGLADLVAPQLRVATPGSQDQRLQQALVILRVVKFIVRWQREERSLDLSGIKEWMALLATDLPSQISDEEWEKLREARRQYLGRVGRTKQRAAARELGLLAAALLDALDARSR